MRAPCGLESRAPRRNAKSNFVHVIVWSCTKRLSTSIKSFGISDMVIRKKLNWLIPAFVLHLPYPSYSVLALSLPDVLGNCGVAEVCNTNLIGSHGDTINDQHHWASLKLESPQQALTGTALTGSEDKKSEQTHSSQDGSRSYSTQIIDHGDENVTESLAQQAKAFTDAGLEGIIQLSKNRRYQFMRDFELPETVMLNPNLGAVLQPYCSIRTAEYHWTASKTGAYYLESIDGHAPKLCEPYEIRVNGKPLTKAIASATLTPSQWTWKLCDRGFYTIFARLDDSEDPNDKTSDSIIAGFIVRIHSISPSIAPYRWIDVSKGGLVVLPKGERVKSSWYGTIKDAIACIGTTPAELEITQSETISISTATQASTRLVATSGNILSIKSGGTFFINGPFDAGLFQVFDTRTGGRVTFANGTIEAVRPEWMGARSDGKTDSTTAIQSAIDSYKVVNFNSGIYILTSPISLKTDVVLDGCGERLTIIKSSCSTRVFQAMGGYRSKGLHTIESLTIRNLRIMGDNNAMEGLRLQGCSQVKLERVKFDGFRGTQLFLDEVWDSWFEDCYFVNGHSLDSAAMVISSGAGDNSNNLKFRGCTWEFIPHQAISLQGGSRSSEKNYQIVFDGCKWEACGSAGTASAIEQKQGTIIGLYFINSFLVPEHRTQPFFRVSPTASARHIRFDNMFIVYRATLGADDPPIWDIANTQQFVISNIKIDGLQIPRAFKPVIMRSGCDVCSSLNVTYNTLPIAPFLVKPDLEVPLEPSSR